MSSFSLIIYENSTRFLSSSGFEFFRVAPWSEDSQSRSRDDHVIEHGAFSIIRF